MVKLALLEKHETAVVVPLPNKRLEAIKAALAAVVPPGVDASRIAIGAGVIFDALVGEAERQKQRRRRSRRALRGLLEFSRPSPLAHTLGVPPRYAREVYMEALMFRVEPIGGLQVRVRAPGGFRTIRLPGLADGSPTRRELQDAARRIHDAGGATWGVWEAYTVLRVARDLRASETSDGRLTVFEKNGKPGGTALAYVQAVLGAMSDGKKIDKTRWPAAYIQADRLIQATDRRFVPARRKTYPRVVVKPYVESAPNSVGHSEDHAAQL